MDIALTNSRLYYKLVNEEKLKKNGESRADFLISGTSNGMLTDRLGGEV